MPPRGRFAPSAPRDSSARRTAASKAVNAFQEDEEDFDDDGDSGAPAKRRRSSNTHARGPVVTGDAEPETTAEQRILAAETSLERASVVLTELGKIDAEG